MTLAGVLDNVRIAAHVAPRLSKEAGIRCICLSDSVIRCRVAGDPEKLSSPSPAVLAQGELK